MKNNTLSSTRLVKTRYKHTMTVDPSDYIGQKIISNGAYDHRSIDLLRPILSTLSCRTILDIGANIGNHALAFSDLCLQLVAFEPGERAYSLLSENVTQNDIRNITTVNVGLSDVSGTATLFVDESGNLGGSTLVDENQGDSTSAESVLVQRGDPYLEEHNINNIDFIKIDVEGHEQAVLSGLKNTLQTQRPLILMESDKDDKNHRWIANKDVFQSLLPDYHIFALIWNSDKGYWNTKLFGRLRRPLVRVFTSKRRVLTHYAAENHGPGTTNLLLVPVEKLSHVQRYVFS